MQWLQDLYARVVDHVENHPTPFERYLHLFFAVLAVRLALEFFSSHRLFTLDDVVHIGLWFVFIVLAFVLQLHLFSGERIEKVAKLVVVFYMFAWSAPILDLLTSRGVPARMNYLSLHSFRDIAWSYVTVGGSSMMRGATLGIRVEIVLLVLASFNYVRIKTGSVTRGLLGAWSIYTVLFLSGAVPLLLGLVVRGFRLAYRQGDQSTLLFLLTLDLALLFAAFWRHSARWMRQVMAAIPWGAGLVAVLLALLGAGLGSKGYPDNVRLDPTTLFWFALVPALLLCLGAFAGLPRTGADPERIRRTGTGLLLLVLAIGTMISPRILFLSGVIWGLLFLLNEPPLRLVQVPVARNVLEALALVSAALLGFVALGGPMVGFPRPWLLCLLAAALPAGLLADLASSRPKDHRRPGVLPRHYALIGLATSLVLAAFVAGGLLLLPTASARALLAALALPPVAWLWRRPERTQWIAASFVPVCALLAVVAWK